MQTLTSGVFAEKSFSFPGHKLLPGIVFTTAIAAAGFELRNLLGIGALSPLVIAIVLGLLFQNLIGTPAAFKPGVVFSMRRVLRLAVVLLGLQLSFSQVAEIGGAGLAIIAATLAGTFLFTLWAGHVVGVDRKLAELIAAGTSICGASAVVATNTVTRASDEDVAYAVACVTVFGSASMLLYPVVQGLLQLTPHAFGLWAGASIHEVAQVVAAAFQNGPDAGNFAMMAKLSRVMLLAPMIMAVGYVSTRKMRARSGQPSAAQSVPVPWFVLGFVAMMLVSSLDVIPAADKTGIVQATTFLLMVALAAMGLQTDIRKLRAKGWKPLLLGAASTLFISVFSLTLIEVIGA